MTALNISTDIPSNITTAEQLAVWIGDVLGNLNSNVTVVEGENYSQRAAQTATFYIASTDSTRHVARQSIAMSPEYLVGGGKRWQYAQELSTKVLTAAMKAN
jgi:hypothetical protein